MTEKDSDDVYQVKRPKRSITTEGELGKGIRVLASMLLCERNNPIGELDKRVVGYIEVFPERCGQPDNVKRRWSCGSVVESEVQHLGCKDEI